jgi:SAM-dependent methyltransferase
VTSTDDPYRDPKLYDLEYRDQHDDIDHYLDVARAHAGDAPLLELGIGNGRIALPLARAGVAVDGVDGSRSMLHDLQERVAGEPADVRARVSARYGLFTTFEVERRYRLVTLPFNALHHCPDHRAVLALFDRVRAALTPDGVFALDCYLPDPALYRRDPNQTYEHRTFVDPRFGGALYSWERSWYDTLAQTHHVIYAYQRPGRVAEELHLRLRMFYPAELFGLFDLGGFEPVQIAGEFDGRPLDGASMKVVALLRARR